MMMEWKQRKNNEFVFRLHPGQSKVLRSQKRFIAAIAGTGGGKTAIGPLWIARELQRLQDASTSRPLLGLVVAPTYQILTRTTIPALVSTFSGTDLDGEHFPSKKQFVFRNGLCSLYLLSADNHEGLEGGQFHLAWLDEAGQFSLSAWIAIQGRLGMHQGRCLITTTPYHLNWLKTEFVDRAKKKDPDYDVITWSSVKNPAYSMDEYERARRTLPPQLFAMRYDGAFGLSENIIFSSFNHDYNVRPCQYDPKLPILVGADFNVNPMCWVLAHKRNNDLEIFDELFLRNTTTQATLDVLYQKYKNHRGWQFFGDATSRARHTAASDSDYIQILNNRRFQNLGRTLHVLQTNPPKQDRFAATNALLCNAADERRLYIDPSCVNLILDIESRTYKPGSREPNDSGDVGHMSDALGYIIYSLFPLRLANANARPQKVSVTR